MSRHRKTYASANRPAVTQSEERLRNHLLSSVETLRQLANTYDAGHTAIAFLMATEALKILTANQAAVRLRGEKRFKSPNCHKKSMTALHRLIVARLTGTVLDFVPTFQARPEAELYDELRFADWWNREKIFIASCAKPGTPLGLIPLYAEDQVKDEERESVSRKEFVEMLRNKLGSHLDEELPALLDDLHQAHSFSVGFQAQVPNGDMIEPEMNTGPIPAMMRQIAEEILVAYGR